MWTLLQYFCTVGKSSIICSNPSINCCVRVIRNCFFLAFKIHTYICMYVPYIHSRMHIFTSKFFPNAIRKILRNSPLNNVWSCRNGWLHGHLDKRTVCHAQIIWLSNSVRPNCQFVKWIWKIKLTHTNGWRA